MTYGLIIVFSLLLCRFDIFHNKMLESTSTNILLLMAFCTPFALFPEDESPGVGLPDPGLETVWLWKWAIKSFFHGTVQVCTAVSMGKVGWASLLGSHFNFPLSLIRQVYSYHYFIPSPLGKGWVKHWLLVRTSSCFYS